MDESAICHQEQPDQKRKLYHLSWNEFNHLTATLVQRIHTEPLPDMIIGLQRGGLIPAVMLSHHLGVQAFLSLPIRRTTSDSVYAAKMLPEIGTIACVEQIAGKHILIVDDIVGSGATLRAALRLLQHYQPTHIQSVVYIVNREHWNPVNTGEPEESVTFVGKELSGWVVFPWEKPAEAQLCS
ncbi:phosphoribosyltransferase [Ktedonobacteria bacterium brp13]|nr:phosphoribosyltransferase [Ktedonobacteria bacterium brp13]